MYINNNTSKKLHIMIWLIFVYCVAINLLKGIVNSQVVNICFILLILTVLLPIPILSSMFLKQSKIQFVAMLNTCLIFILYLYSLLYLKVNFTSATAFTAQFVLFWLVLFLLTENINKYLSNDQVLSLLRSVYKLSYFVILLSLIERFVPLSYLVKIVNMMSDSKQLTGSVGASVLPSSYMFAEASFPIQRAGSIFLEPLTFSLFAGLITVSYYDFLYFAGPLDRRKEAKYKFVYISLTVLCFVKSGVILMSSLLAKHKFFLILFGFSVLVLFAVNINSIENLESILVHVNGLINGLASGFEKPFLGHGAGTAGFLSYNILSNQGELYNYFDSSNMSRNGNESLIGIISYQYGYVYLTFYLLSFVYLSYQTRKNLKYFPSLVIIVLVVSLFTESVLSMIFQFTYALLFVLLNSLSSKNIYENIKNR